MQLVSGDRIDIEHPEALVFRNRVAVFFGPDGEIAIFDHEGVAQVAEKPDQAASA